MIKIVNRRQFKGRGFFYILHDPTGKVYAGVTMDLEKELLKIQAELKANKFENAKLQKLWNAEPDFYCIATLGPLSKARIYEKEFRSTKGDLLVN